MSRSIQLPKGIVRTKPELPVVAAKTEPTGLPKPKVQAKPEDSALAAAQAAVETYETQYRVLTEMKEDWEANYPEAHQALETITQQTDVVMDAINKAHALVALAKKTVGDFVATPKFTKAHYDDETVTQILSGLSNRLEVFEKMVDSGIVDTVSLKRDAALAWFSQHPDLANVFQPAFKDRKEATCAVSRPKI